jgi:hypothetical protein
MVEGVMVVVEDQEAVCPVWSSWVAEDRVVEEEEGAVAVIEVALVVGAAATRAGATA